MSRKEDSEKALKKVIHDANEVLAEAITVFTFQPTTLTLTRAKLIAEKRSPFGARSVMSVPVEDLVHVSASVGLIFGTITIGTKFTSPDKPHKIGLLWRQDAIKLKRLIEGCIIAIKKKIDLSTLPTDELKELLYELGTDDHSIK